MQCSTKMQVVSSSLWKFTWACLESEHFCHIWITVYICWVSLAELIWLCSRRFHWSTSLCNRAVVFECDVDGTCGQEGALLFWSAVACVAAVSQYLFYPLTLSYCYWNSSQVYVRHVLLFFLCATKGQVQSRSWRSGWHLKCFMMMMIIIIIVLAYTLCLY